MKDCALLVQTFLIFLVALEVKSYPSTVVRSYPLRGLECFPDDLRLPCDCDTGNTPCCKDKITGECYEAAYTRWSDWIPCELCNDECDEEDECRIKYEEIPQLSRLKRTLWDDAGQGRRNKRRVPFLTGGPHVNPHWRPMHGRYRCLVMRHECRPAEIDGHRWGAWIPMGPCSSVCEFGTRPEKRSCYNPIGLIVNASHCVGGEENAIRSVFCNEDLCREFSNWLEDENCYVYTEGDDVMCLKNATRTCIHEPEDVETREEEDCTVEMRPCDESECDFTGVSGIGNWTEWSTCNCSCKPGWQSRVGICIYFDTKAASTECDALEETEYKRCNTDLCEEYSAWGPITECSKTCETGILTEGRTCLDSSVTVPEFCTTRMKLCNSETCPIIDYGNFTEWSACNSTCYVGYQTRMGTCINRTSLEASTDCPEGPMKEFMRMCNTDACVSYGSWDVSGPCSVTCGSGSQPLSRTCEVWLEGSAMEVDPSCVTDTMPCSGPGCVIYNNWANWDTCSETCGRGVQTRTRECVLEDDPLTPASGCPDGDNDVEVQLCNTDLCNSYSDFEEFCEIGAVDCQAYPDQKRRTCNGTGTVVEDCLTTSFVCTESALPQYDIGIIIDQTHNLDLCKDKLTAAGRSPTDIPVLASDPLYNAATFPNFMRQKQFVSEFYCGWDSVSSTRSKFGVMSSYGFCTNSYVNTLDDMNIEPFLDTLPYACGELSNVVYYSYCHRPFQFFSVAKGERLGVKNVLITVVPQLNLQPSDFTNFLDPLKSHVLTTLSSEQIHFFVISSLNYTDSAYDAERNTILADYHSYACINETETSCDYFLGSIYQPIGDVFQKIRDVVN